MTNKQTLFISEYLKDRNATKAAIRSGYSENGAAVQGHLLLRNTNIAKAVRESLDDALESSKMSLKNDVVDKLRDMAFEDEEINPTHQLKALELLGKFMTMFTERIELDAKVGLYDDLTDEEALARVAEIESK